MKRFLLVLIALVCVAVPARAATGLSSITFTNLNKLSFITDLSAAPTNMVKLNLRGPGGGGGDSPGDLWTFLSTNVFNLWTNDNGNYRPIQLQNTITITNVQAEQTLSALGFLNTTPMQVSGLAVGTNDLSFATYRSSDLLLISDGDSTNPVDRVVRLQSASPGTLLILANRTNNAVVQSAWTLRNGDSTWDGGGGINVLPNGDFSPTLPGEGILLRCDGLNWCEIERFYGPAGPSTNTPASLIINPTVLYGAYKTGSNSFGDLPLHLPSLGSTNMIVDGQLIFGPGDTNIFVRIGNALWATNQLPELGVNSGAATMSLKIIAGTTPHLAASSSIYADQEIVTKRIVPDVDNTHDIGSASSNGAYHDSFFKGEQHTVASNDGSGNSSWVRTFATNGIAVFDFVNNGSGTPPTKFSFRTNGVEVLTAGSGGTAANWTASGPTNQTSAGIASVNGLVATNGVTSATNFTAYGNYLGAIDYTQISGFYLAANLDSSASVTTSGGFITNWVTLGASLYNAVQSTNGPTLTTNSNGDLAAGFWGTNYLKFATPDTSINSNVTIFVVYEPATASTGTKYLLGGSSTHLQWDVTAGANNLSLWLNSGSGLKDPNTHLTVRSTSTTIEPKVRVAGVRFVYGDATWAGANQLTYDYATTCGTYTNALLSWRFSGETFVGSHRAGPTSSTYGFTGKISEVLIFTNAIPLVTYETILRGLRAKYNVKTQGYVLMDGDSHFIGGAMGTSEKGFAPVFHQIDDFLQPHQSTIAAVTTRTAADVEAAATNYTSGNLATSYYAARKDNLYLLYFGNKSLQTNTAAAVWPVVSNSWKSAKLQGYVVPAMTFLPAGGTNDAERLAFNALVQQHWPVVADTLVDFTILPYTTPSDYTNTVYYLNDGTSGYTPSAWQSSQCVELLLRHLRRLCSTNLITQ